MEVEMAEINYPVCGPAGHNFFRLYLHSIDELADAFF